MTSFRRIGVVATAVLSVPLLAILAQQPQPAPASADTASVHSRQNPQKGKSQHSDDFLVKGTVFTPGGLSLPWAKLSIRRNTERKFRWKTYTNSRGEFAVRVKQGSQYEVVVRAKGFKEQSKTLDATSGNVIDDMVFRMEPAGGDGK